MRVINGLTAMLFFASCSPAASDLPENTMNVDETLTTENVVDLEEPEPTQIAHRNYDFREGNTYGYIAAISEEERKEGKAAGDVITYIYRGKSGTMHRLDRVDPTGRIIGSAECTTPCVAIKMTSRYGRVERIAFNPGSIIGGAFEDAINGFLEVTPEVTPEPERIDTTQFDTSADSNNPPASSNWTIELDPAEQPGE